MKKGAILMMVGMLWCQGETVFFLCKYGYHYYPNNLAEFICDCVAAAMCFYGFRIFIKGLYQNKY